ncbi:hypothetical protein Gotur_006658 [Gossypium turneri]
MFMRVVATGDKIWGPSSEMMFTFQIMFTLIETVKKGEKMRYQLHVLKIEGRNPQSKLEGMQDCLVK